MSAWESVGQSDEWYTPKYIPDAMGVQFDMDVASPREFVTNIPAKAFITEGSLEEEWIGFVWMNPPFGGRNSLQPWLEKFFAHRNGVALTPDRTSAPWYQNALGKCDALLMINGKVKFERPDGSIGKSPSTGTTLWASGAKGCMALRNASNNGLGKYLEVL